MTLERDQQESSPPDAELVSWVAWYVESYEAWAHIPSCWALHPAMVAELEAAMELALAFDARSAGDPVAEADHRAQWHDYRGRMMDRLAQTPGALCARRHQHHPPTTWDRVADAERRRAARAGEQQEPVDRSATARGLQNAPKATRADQ